MAEKLDSIDVFKFVALRPAQLASERVTALSTMRDERTASEEGRRALAQEVRAARNEGPDEVRERERALKRLAAAASEATRRMAEAAPSDDPLSFLADGDELSDERAEALWATAWAALYAAYGSGPDAAARLEAPTAALRWLHARRLAAAGRIETIEQLATALSATPLVIPLDAGPAPAAPRPEADRERAPAGAEERQSHERLLGDIDATQRLLAATRLQPSAEVKKLIDVDNSCATARRAEVSISSVPRLTAAMTERPSVREQSVLSALGIRENTSVASATRTLEHHLTGLNRQAYGLRSNAQFMTLAQKSGNVELLKLLPPSSSYVGAVNPLPGIFTSLRSTKDVDVRGKIKPLGIGDLKVAKQTLLAYVPGEVAHIENVLKGESKERKHRTLDRMETFQLTVEEETQETERDTQTTDRFELKREAEKTIKEDMNVSAGLTVTGSYGMVSVTAQGNFAYATSQQESQKNSANFAREVVERSVSKIQKKVKTERSTRNLREVEETNTHGVDNVGGPGHVTGVYRWVDKRYRAQVYNYGVRLMIEFVVPEPAAYFRASQIAAKAAAVNAIPPEPFLDQKGGPLTPSDINPSNYQLFAARYNATGVAPPDPEYLYFATALEQGGIQDGQAFSKSSKEIALPAGYIFDHYAASASILYANAAQFSLQIAGETHHVLNDTRSLRMATAGYGIYWGGDWEDDPRGVVPVSVIGYDINAYTVHVEVTCRRTDELYQKWQLQTFDKIYTAYKALQTEYDQKVAQAQARAGAIIIEGRNPGLNREIEKRELKKLCVTLLTGKHFNDRDAMVYPSPPTTEMPEVDVLEALREGPVAQFFEQAFEWEQMTYLFYPYFWAQKSQWLATSNQNDPDPLFAQFLQSGAARVVIPVPMAYKDAVLYFLETGAIWEGGETPRLDDPLFVSLAEELRNRTDDLAGATPEGTPWEFSIPTTLVWLQPGPELPVLNA